jgi:hypothetical protein
MAKRPINEADFDLSDLRRAAAAQEEELVFGHEALLAPEPDDGRLFGMSAVERMFLSIGLFFVTVVTSVVILAATNSIAF